MRILAPKEYASLPKLEAPAGYICVLRDIDRDVYRIDSMDHPAVYMEGLLAELTGTYGIELLSILESDDIAASEMRLYENHHAALGGHWLELDAYQFRALRKSELRILDYGSYYISQRQTSPADDAERASSLAKPGEGSAAGQSHRQDPDAPSPPVMEYFRYGERGQSQPEAYEPDSWRQSLSDKFDDFLHSHPRLVIAFMLLVMLLILIEIWRDPYLY